MSEDYLGSEAYAGVYDVVNLTGPGMLWEARTVLDSGGMPISIQRMPNGIDYMVDEVVKRVAAMGTIDLLRIHGHGAPGIQTISCGVDLYKKELPRMRSILSSYNFDTIRNALMRLNGCFAQDAKVWLMGCEVGARQEGWNLIHKLSKLWGVEVTAGVPTQYGGITESFAHEGGTITCMP